MTLSLPGWRGGGGILLEHALGALSVAVAGGLPTGAAPRSLKALYTHLSTLGRQSLWLPVDSTRLTWLWRRDKGTQVKVVPVAVKGPVVAQDGIPLRLGQLSRLGGRVGPADDQVGGVVGHEARQGPVGEGGQLPFFQLVGADVVEELLEGLVLAGQVDEVLFDG